MKTCPCHWVSVSCTPRNLPAGPQSATAVFVCTQMEEAVELYMYAGAPRPALHLLNHQLSDLVEPALDDRVAGELKPPSSALTQP
jgi:hypothetical protein